MGDLKFGVSMLKLNCKVLVYCLFTNEMGTYPGSVCLFVMAGCELVHRFLRCLDFLVGQSLSSHSYLV